MYFPAMSATAADEATAKATAIRALQRAQQQAASPPANIHELVCPPGTIVHLHNFNATRIRVRTEFVKFMMSRGYSVLSEGIWYAIRDEDENADTSDVDYIPDVKLVPGSSSPPISPSLTSSKYIVENINGNQYQATSDEGCYKMVFMIGIYDSVESASADASTCLDIDTTAYHPEEKTSREVARRILARSANILDRPVAIRQNMPRLISMLRAGWNLGGILDDFPIASEEAIKRAGTCQMCKKALSSRGHMNKRTVWCVECFAEHADHVFQRGIYVLRD